VQERIREIISLADQEALARPHAVEQDVLDAPGEVLALSGSSARRCGLAVVVVTGNLICIIDLGCATHS
jgi:hypothetical protein